MQMTEKLIFNRIQRKEKVKIHISQKRALKAVPFGCVICRNNDGK